MKDRLLTFAGITAILSGAFALVFAVMWALISFAVWRLFSPPPMEFVRLIFGLCCIAGAICAICQEPAGD